MNDKQIVLSVEDSVETNIYVLLFIPIQHSQSSKYRDLVFGDLLEFFNESLSRGKSETSGVPYSLCTPLVLPKKLGVDEVSLFPPWKKFSFIRQTLVYNFCFTYLICTRTL
jgi:hypothetical protein